VYSPPPGFTDLLSDAALWPPAGEFEDLSLVSIGAVRARPPRARAVAYLAMVDNTSLKPHEQRDYLTRFVLDHLDTGEYQRVLSGVFDGDFPHDSVQRIARKIATWGTARPYAAVLTLSLFTGHNWRTVRQKLANAGMTSPLLLPSLHAVLDVTEDIVTESLLAPESEGPPSEGEKRLRRFYDAIYAPDPPEEEIVAGSGHSPPPTSFENPDAVEDAFDAFLRQAR